MYLIVTVTMLAKCHICSDLPCIPTDQSELHTRSCIIGMAAAIAHGHYLLTGSELNKISCEEQVRERRSRDQRWERGAVLVLVSSTQ